MLLDIAHISLASSAWYSNHLPGLVWHHLPGISNPLKEANDPEYRICILQEFSCTSGDLESHSAEASGLQDVPLRTHK